MPQPWHPSESGDKECAVVHPGVLSRPTHCTVHGMTDVPLCSDWVWRAQRATMVVDVMPAEGEKGTEGANGSGGALKAPSRIHDVPFPVVPFRRAAMWLRKSIELLHPTIIRRRSGIRSHGVRHVRCRRNAEPALRGHRNQFIRVTFCQVNRTTHVNRTTPGRIFVPQECTDGVGRALLASPQHECC
jgi:hypothetical protein